MWEQNAQTDRAHLKLYFKNPLVTPIKKKNGRIISVHLYTKGHNYCQDTTRGGIAKDKEKNKHGDC